MEKQMLEIKVALQVQKPVGEVFEAIVDDKKMANYFIAQSSGRMEEGRELVWRFPEFDMDVPVRVGRVEKDRLVSYEWDGEAGPLTVNITLAPAGDAATVVTITEGQMEHNAAGISWLKGNTEGWANFLACLKAYVEHGINLRKGAFDFRKEEFAAMK